MITREIKYEPSKKIRTKFKKVMERWVSGITDLSISDQSMSQLYRSARELNTRHQQLFGASAVEVIYGGLDIKSLIKL